MPKNKANPFVIFLESYVKEHYPRESLSNKWRYKDEASKIWESLSPIEKETYRDFAQNKNNRNQIRPYQRGGRERTISENSFGHTSRMNRQLKPMKYSFEIGQFEIRNYLDRCFNYFRKLYHSQWSKTPSIFTSTIFYFASVCVFEDIPFTDETKDKGILIDFEREVNQGIDMPKLRIPGLIPVEFTLIGYSLKNGVESCYHTFIKPGKIPLGYTYNVMSSSNDKHKIPEGGHPDSVSPHEVANYLRNLHVFTPKKDIPIYTLKDSCNRILQTLEWLNLKSQTDVPFAHILPIEYLMKDILNNFSPELSQTIEEYDLTSIVKNPSYLIEKNRCDFHKKVDSDFCSLREVLSFAHSFSEHICSIFDIKCIGELHFTDAEYALSKEFKTRIYDTYDDEDYPPIC